MRILIIDDHRLFREAIGHVLRELEEKVVLIEAGTAEEAIGMVRHYQDLDLILLDLNMPGMGGLSSLPKLLELAPTAPVVVVSGSAAGVDVRSAINAGAAGFIPKTASSHELASALRVVLSGEIYVPPSLLSVVDAAATPARHRQASARSRSRRDRRRCCSSWATASRTSRSPTAWA